MPDRTDDYDVAILGAGPIGCAIAYHLARRKIASVVLDREGPGGSHAVSGRVWVSPDASEQYARLCVRAIERYPVLEGEIGSFEYRRSGGLAPALTDAGTRAGVARAQRQAEAGLDVRWVSREEARRLEPSLSPEILGAVYSPHEGSVNPDLLVRRLVNAARRIGGTFLLHCGHLTVRPHPGGFLIRGGRGEIQASRLVLASSADDPEMRRQVEVPLPLRRVHEVTLVTEALPPLLHHTVASSPPEHSFGDVREARGTNSSHVIASAYQKVSGEVVLEGPASSGIAFDTILAAARDAARLLPPLATARVLRASAGSQVVSTDDAPILGAAGENMYIAIGSQESTLCPLLGEALTEIITRRRVSEDIAGFGPERFAASAATPAGPRQDSGRTP